MGCTCSESHPALLREVQCNNILAHFLCVGGCGDGKDSLKISTMNITVSNSHATTFEPKHVMWDA